MFYGTGGDTKTDEFSEKGGKRIGRKKPAMREVEQQTLKPAVTTL